ncbi:hypothetical protein Pmani_016869 [Petrolisthes manimaculis]|uniref:Uncharacterized protein n=1 Tax=Petrolisthes manimaculis TaxID=1843537 RepID=A0AAE1U602_9EUCA|nr:hypothetical protein Pmani_016869 [Petrolisthes manimaculis]
MSRPIRRKDLRPLPALKARDVDLFRQLPTPFNILVSSATYGKIYMSKYCLKKLNKDCVPRRVRIHYFDDSMSC